MERFRIAKLARKLNIATTARTLKKIRNELAVGETPKIAAIIAVLRIEPIYRDNE